MNILFICIFFVASNGTAQEAVSSNGKFATINGLKLYYEESGELLTTKVFAIAGATERNFNSSNSIQLQFLSWRNNIEHLHLSSATKQKSTSVPA